MEDAYENAVEAIEKALGLVKDFEHEHSRLFRSLFAEGYWLHLRRGRLKC